MRRKKVNKFFFINALFFFTGLTTGIIFIWPGIVKVENRSCFINIIKDGGDGKISLGTFLSIEPNYLLKINKSETKYRKILLIGDHCFRQ